MNRTDKIIAISYPLILLAITIACTGALLSNYSSGKYSSEADSLIIPLSAIAFTLLALVFLYALQLPYYTRRPSQSGRGLAKKTVAIIATTISLTTFGWIIKFWSGATNLSIQLLYISAAIIFAGFQYRLYQKK